MKRQFVYFFKCSVVLEPIVSLRKNSGICCSSIGPNLLVLCCVKAISIHVISSKRLDPIGKAIGNLPQLGTHRHIVLCLQVRHIIRTYEQLVMPYTTNELNWTLPFVSTKK